MNIFVNILFVGLDLIVVVEVIKTCLTQFGMPNLWGAKRALFVVTWDMDVYRFRWI